MTSPIPIRRFCPTPPWGPQELVASTLEAKAAAPCKALKRPGDGRDHG